MQLLNVIPLSFFQTQNAKEYLDCFLDHLKNLPVSSLIPPAQNNYNFIDPGYVGHTLEETNAPVALMDTGLRFLVEPERLSNLDCDIALFTNRRVPLGSKEYFDPSFILFKPTPKTLAFLKIWSQKTEKSKEKDLLSNFYSLLKTEALRMQILPLNPLLKKEAVDDSPFFLRWFLKV